MEKSASYDSSTPQGKDQLNSGVIGFHYNDKHQVDGAVITDHAKDRYCALVESYKVQYKGKYFSVLHGIEDLREYDDDGSMVWFIDAEHLQAFMRMNRWAKEGRKKDGVIDKLKDAI